MFFFFFKQTTAYVMRISDWSSYVCSSDLGSRSRGSAAIVISIRRNRNDSLPGSRGSLMDIGYFLKLMTEKNASDMFLTTGAPVYIKVEGKLYPLGNTGLPQGMVKKIAYSLMDEGQVPARKSTRLNSSH